MKKLFFSFGRVALGEGQQQKSSWFQRARAANAGGFSPRSEDSGSGMRTWLSMALFMARSGGRKLLLLF